MPRWYAACLVRPLLSRAGPATVCDLYAGLVTLPAYKTCHGHLKSSALSLAFAPSSRRMQFLHWALLLHAVMALLLLHAVTAPILLHVLTALLLLHALTALLLLHVVIALLLLHAVTAPLLTTGVAGYGTQICMTYALKFAKAAPALAMSYLSVVWGLLGGFFFFHEVSICLYWLCAYKLLLLQVLCRLTVSSAQKPCCISLCCLKAPKGIQACCT